MPDDAAESRIEEYQQMAVTTWLPEALETNREPARAALARLASLLRTSHGDPWLGDLLATRASGGMSALARAVSLNIKGRHTEAERSARDAVVQFGAHSPSGRLRARMEIVYALNRQVRGADCVAASSGPAAELRLRNYRWGLAQLLLDQSTCRKITGDFAGARRDIEEAASVSQAAHFGVLELQGLGMAAGLDRFIGNAAGAWSKDRRGLLLYWTGAYPPSRAHQFCTDLALWARKFRRWHLATALAREAVAAIASTPNQPSEAVARYTLASAATAAGLWPEAEAEFRRAATLFDRMPQDRMTQAYRSYSELGLVTLAAQRHDFQAPLESISRLRSQIDPSAHFLLALTFHTTAGTLYLRQGDAARAEQDFQSGLRLAQRALQSIQGDSDRLRWQAEMAELYRGLVRIRLDRHDVRGALATWLEFRGASIDPGTLASHSLLVYTQFPDGLAAWLADDRGVSYHWTSIRAEDLQQVVEQYTGLCADPGAAPALLRAPAERLYGWLVRPFAERLQPSRTLLVSSDGIVGRLPLQTLFDDRFAVASVPGAITSGGGERFTPDAHALVVAAPALPAAAAMFPPLPDAAREGSSVAARFLHPTVLAGTAAVLAAVLQRMPDAEIFHFAGHAMIAAAEPGLVLAARHGDSPEVLGAGSLAPGILRRCRLAVLSACGSAAGESDLVLDPDDFVRGLLRAGAANVIASRWKVDSRATAVYMDGLYHALLAGRSLPVAMREAAAPLRRRDATSHPYFWAAFDLFSRELP